MLSTTTMHLTHKYCHSSTARAGYLHIIFQYNPYYYKFKSDPQILNIVLCAYAHVITHTSGARVHNVAMGSLWEVYDNTTTPYTTIYAQILGAPSSISW